MCLFYRELFGDRSTGINFEKYDNIPVEATGESCPQHIQSFAECNFSDIIKENIKVGLVKVGLVKLGLVKVGLVKVGLVKVGLVIVG